MKFYYLTTCPVYLPFLQALPQQERNRFGNIYQPTPPFNPTVEGDILFYSQ